MLSKNKAKFIKALQQKKFRAEHGCFVVEGKKSVLELISSPHFSIRTVVCTETFRKEHESVLKDKKLELLLCSLSELESISSFKTNNSVLAVVNMRGNYPPEKLQGLTLALDKISDPGNLGALIRTADWFGIKNIVASEETTELYNPKVLQASMGSFCRISVYYTKLEKYLQDVRIPIYAASMKGENIHNFRFEENCVLIMGNESHGVSNSLLRFIQKTVNVPSYGKAESLNVAMAAAIMCDHYRRILE